MGIYVNPGNGSFASDTRGRIYVDKTGLLEILNGLLGTSDCCIALSHARRFGKSQAAGMIDAYYSRGSDSRELFSKFEIAKAPDFETHLNKYNVIHLDISPFCSRYADELVERVWRSVYRELLAAVPGLPGPDETYSSVLMDVYEKTGVPFVIIIDEWDCVIRNLGHRPGIVHAYMQFLHDIFKSEEAKSFLALAYITGILPIKKIHDESALNNFDEYTMTASDELTPYFGFTENEVRTLCEKHGMAFDSVKEWYDGYLINGRHMFNPNSVCKAIHRKRCESYWKNTSAFETINDFVTLDFDGLKQDVLRILAGEKIRVNVLSFQNDLTQIRSKDEALTALIHLGYLGYDADRKAAYLPNFEVGEAFEAALIVGGWSEVAKSISRCNELLDATIDGDADRVAELVDLAHESYASILQYNNENSLSCVLTMAYFTAPAYYDIEREAPAGKGYADMLFRPRSEAGSRPAMIVELKWNDSPESAVRQIRERHYAGALASHKGDILLVGISYDKESKDKRHSCVIERFRNEDAATNGPAIA